MRPGSGFYAQLKNNCPKLRQLELIDFVLEAPVLITIEMMSVRNSTVTGSCWPVAHFDGQQPHLEWVELDNVDIDAQSMTWLPDCVKTLTVTNTQTVYWFRELPWIPHVPTQVHFRHFKRIWLC